MSEQIKQQSSKIIEPLQFNNAHLTEAYEIYKDLHKTINQMDQKIQQVIKQHQAEFLFAYRNHIKKMKEQLGEIKEKTDEQEKKMNSNDRTQFLEKQLTIFREEALKMYQKLDQKTQEAEIYKSRVKDYQRMEIIYEKENKQLLKNYKIYQAKCELYQGKIKSLEKDIQSLKEKDEGIEKYNFKKLNNKQSKGQTNISEKGTLNIDSHKKYSTENKIQELQKDQQIIENSYKGFRVSKSIYEKHGYQKMNKLRLLSVSKDEKTIFNTIKDYELKSWFLECINSVRREVAQRKVYNQNTIDFGVISSLEEFRMIDKLRLLEMFIQNQKLLVCMYEKIFPDRMSEIKDFLSISQYKITQEKSKSKSMSIKLVGNELLQRNLYEEMKDIKTQDKIERKDSNKNAVDIVGKDVEKLRSKSKKNEIRNRIVIKNGKLNISSID